MNQSELDLVPFSKAHKPGMLEGLRSLFYLILPSESKFKDVSLVPNYPDSVTECFLTFIILEFVIGLWKDKKNFQINDGLTNLSAGILSRITMLTGRSVELTLYIYVYENWRLADLPWDANTTWILAFLGVDFFYYWLHRASHEVNFIWASHQAHHSSQYYNFTTALRQSVTQTYFLMWGYLPNALLIPPSIHLIHSNFSLLYQFWIHTEIIESIGPLEHILNTPSHHRVHHGRNPYCIDKNYGGTLIIWDRIFGTFEAEKKDVQLAYGLVKPLRSFNLFTVQFGLYKNLCINVWNAKGISNKLSLILKGPGWSEGKPRLGEHADLPEVENPISLYNPQISRWLLVYVLVHFGALVPLYIQMVTLKLKIPDIILMMDVFYFIGSLTFFGAMFDKRSYAYKLESVRCFLGAIILHLFEDTFNTAHEFPFNIAFFLEILYLISTVFWIALGFTSTGKVKKA